jgi:hypothetical protein
LKDSLFTTQFRYAAIATIAGLLAGCSGGGGSSPAYSGAGSPAQSAARLPVEAAYPDYVASLDDVPVSPDITCTSKAAPSTKTVALPAAGGTVTIPKYLSFTGGATVPSSTPAGAKVTIKDSTNNFDKQTVPSGQKGVFFTSLELSETVTFSSDTLTSNLKSTCLIDGAKYTVNAYAFGGNLQPAQVVTAKNHTLSFSVSLSATGGQFPGGVVADLVVSKPT